MFLNGLKTLFYAFGMGNNTVGLVKGQERDNFRKPECSKESIEIS